MSDPSEQAQMAEDCETRESRLSDFERSFVDSIKRQLTEGRALSKKQDSMLTDIWEAATARG